MSGVRCPGPPRRALLSLEGTRLNGVVSWRDAGKAHSVACRVEGAAEGELDVFPEARSDPRAHSSVRSRSLPDWPPHAHFYCAVPCRAEPRLRDVMLMRCVALPTLPVPCPALDLVPINPRAPRPRGPEAHSKLTPSSLDQLRPSAVRSSPSSTTSVSQSPTNRPLRASGPSSCVSQTTDTSIPSASVCIPLTRDADVPSKDGRGPS